MTDILSDSLSPAPMERADLRAIEDASALVKVQSEQLREANSQLVLAMLRAQTAEAALREVAQHKDEFIAMVGHELRNPLVPIRNAAEVLNRLAADNPRLTWVHGVLVRQVGHLARMIDDLLDISRITYGTMPIVAVPVDLCVTVRWAVEATEPLLTQRRHHLACRVAQDPLWVAGDAIRLVQVFENLLTNAAKYTQESGAIAVSVVVEEQTAVVRVSDNGIGILPSMLPRIFDLFVQDARSLDRSQGGLGIGLALVHHLVKLHGGTVEAHSAGVDQGSEFVVRLPLLTDVTLANTASALAPVSGTGRVLIVDDDPEAGETMAVLLQLDGYSVARAVDLDSALLVGATFLPQVVLMDIALPGADGYEVAERLRGLPGIGHETIFIALTGFGRPDDLRRSEEAGFAHHLVKPIEPVELEKLLAQAIATLAARKP
jgi:two-component system, chemotaxis family, CheB/CheR fusion protein